MSSVTRPKAPLPFSFSDDYVEQMSVLDSVLDEKATLMKEVERVTSEWVKEGCYLVKKQRIEIAHDICTSVAYRIQLLDLRVCGLAAVASLKLPPYMRILTNEDDNILNSNPHNNNVIRFPTLQVNLEPFKMESEIKLDTSCLDMLGWKGNWTYQFGDGVKRRKVSKELLGSVFIEDMMGVIKLIYAKSDDERTARILLSNIINTIVLGDPKENDGFFYFINEQEHFNPRTDPYDSVNNYVMSAKARYHMTVSYWTLTRFNPRPKKQEVLSFFAARAMTEALYEQIQKYFYRATFPSMQISPEEIDEKMIISHRYNKNKSVYSDNIKQTYSFYYYLFREKLGLVPDFTVLPLNKIRKVVYIDPTHLIYEIEASYLEKWAKYPVVKWILGKDTWLTNISHPMNKPLSFEPNEEL